MERLPFRRLLVGPHPSPERLFYTNVWFKGHNNPRYAELLPRLSRLDRYLVVCSDRRLVRAAQWRALVATRHARHAAVIRLASRRYPAMFTADIEQIPYFAGPVVADVDDPLFTPREVELLLHPNLRAFVVTHASAGERLRSLGVSAEYHVVPQGVGSRSVSPERVRQAAGLKEDGLVVGYVAAWLLSSGDRGGDNPLYNVDHLLELWDEISASLPGARLWLIGEPSGVVRERCRDRPDITLFGRLPREEMYAHLANVDVALYPRTADQGVQAVKLAEYVGLGIPTVSYDYEVSSLLRETGAGVLVQTPREFVDAVVALARDPSRRAALAERARAAGAELDWDVLAAGYEELLDRVLPPAPARGLSGR